jgi:hypothetical protein
VRRLLPLFRWVPVSTFGRERRPSEGQARGRIDWTMREPRERYPRPDAQLAPSSAGPVMLATSDTRLTPRSLARTTVRRATSHADPKAAATRGHRNLAAAQATTPRDATQVLALTGHHKPVNQTARLLVETLRDSSGMFILNSWLCRPAESDYVFSRAVNP